MRRNDAVTLAKVLGQGRLAVCLLAMLAAFCTVAHAQSLSYLGAQTVVGGGLDGPQHVAVDSAGNIYVADALNNRVVKYPVSAPVGGGTWTSAGGGYGHPVGLAIDATGDLFVADEGNNAIYELNASGTTALPFKGLASVADVTVDAKGDVFAVGSG
jgi:protein involved in polysaccharide export with SLBB domain